MADGEAFKQATDEITAFARERQVDMVVGPEARGFIVGCPVAYKLGVGFAPARKKSKLPRATVSASTSWNMARQRCRWKTTLLSLVSASW